MPRTLAFSPALSGLKVIIGRARAVSVAEILPNRHHRRAGALRGPCNSKPHEDRAAAVTMLLTVASVLITTARLAEADEKHGFDRQAEMDSGARDL